MSAAAAWSGSNWRLQTYRVDRKHCRLKDHTPSGKPSKLNGQHRVPLRSKCNFITVEMTEVVLGGILSLFMWTRETKTGYQPLLMSSNGACPHWMNWLCANMLFLQSLLNLTHALDLFLQQDEARAEETGQYLLYFDKYQVLVEHSRYWKRWTYHHWYYLYHPTLWAHITGSALADEWGYQVIEAIIIRPRVTLTYHQHHQHPH